MCRMFALRASHATRVRGSLAAGPTSLRQQSCGDSRCETHGDGWGIGYYVADRPARVRSVNAASRDPHFLAVAEPLAARTVLAHVRRSSMGEVAERNSHPFTYGKWLFAHNGTLLGFGDARDRLRAMIPEPLRQAITGDTDSEHAFFLLLARLRQLDEPLDGPANPEAVGRAMAEVLLLLKELCPGKEDEESQLNFVLTDGQVLAASRWGYTLYWLERRGDQRGNPDVPISPSPDYRAVAVASEPTTGETWEELPERSVLCVRPDFGSEIKAI